MTKHTSYAFGKFTQLVVDAFPKIIFLPKVNVSLSYFQNKIVLIKYEQRT